MAPPIEPIDPLYLHDKSAYRGGQLFGETLVYVEQQSEESPQ
jgi:hypothetical protein